MIQFEEGKTTKVHMSACIDWLLSPKDLSGSFDFEKDKKSTDKECRDHLLKLKDEGYLYMPIGSCNNFDPKNGCQGHISEEHNDESSD